MTDLEIILHDETQLVDWGESRAGGPWVKLRLTDPALLEAFRGMDTATAKKTGHILHCTLATGDIAALAEQQPAARLESVSHGAFWRDLIASGFFRAPAVLRAIGPERDFEDWVRDQPSVLDGKMDIVFSEICQGYAQRNQCCHVRRVSRGAGTAEKPPYFAVSMTTDQHRLQHHKGEAAVIEKYRPGLTLGNFKDWFASQADKFQTEWASRTLAEALKPGHASRSEVSPESVYQWAVEHGLEVYIPTKWRPGNGES